LFFIVNDDDDFLGLESRTRTMPYPSRGWSVKRSHHHDDSHHDDRHHDDRHLDDHYRADRQRDDWFEDVDISSAASTEDNDGADDLSSLTHYKGVSNGSNYRQTNTHTCIQTGKQTGKCIRHTQ